MPGNEALGALARIAQDLHGPDPLVHIYGRVAHISASGIGVTGLARHVKIGDFVDVLTDGGTVMTEVIKINGSGITVLPLGSNNSISMGCRARPLGNLKVSPDESWKGRICNALAEPIDGKSHLLPGPSPVNLLAAPPKAMLRGLISERVATGVKAVDMFTPLCYGQRIGIFAGSGVGKSTLLAMMSRSDGFDTAIVALVGERGREVKEFVHDVLGDTLKKSIVVVATSDEPPVMRRTAALLATSLAEYFRDRGDKVLLVMDSLTRYAQACREISLAAGEPPVARGFPPSVFSELPLLLERAGPGASGNGAITGVYTVLVDGDDHNDPVADTVRGTLDGHIVLDRQIAAGGRYPAIDLLLSISRLAQKAWTPAEAAAVSKWRKLLMRFEDSRDLRALGGYVRGGDAELDEAIALVPQLYAALEQSPGDPVSGNIAPPISPLKQPSN
ncbi:MAG: flagellar protein export ATPase FliI [Rhizobiales bacterium]|nr:flagellar protein export ATPase FliI [Hyphomicrobiales bacterium]